MTQKFRLVKEGAPNPGEYLTAPGYFRAAKQHEKLSQQNMAAVGNRNYTTDRTKAYVVELSESTSPDYKAEFEVLHGISLDLKCRLEPTE